MYTSDYMSRVAGILMAEAKGFELRNTPARQEMEEKGVRRVRTPAGERRFKQKIGSIITNKGRLDNLTIEEPMYIGFELVRDKKGRKYDVGKDGGRWVAYHHGPGSRVMVEADSEEGVYDALDDAVVAKKAPTKKKVPRPVPKAKESAPKKAPSKKPQDDAPASDDNVVSSDPGKRSAKYKAVRDAATAAMERVDDAKTEDENRRALVDLEKAKKGLEDYITSKGSESDFARLALPKVERAMAKARAQIKRHETRRQDAAAKESKPKKQMSSNKDVPGKPGQFPKDTPFGPDGFPIQTERARGSRQTGDYVPGTPKNGARTYLMVAPDGSLHMVNSKREFNSAVFIREGDGWSLSSNHNGTGTAKQAAQTMNNRNGVGTAKVVSAVPRNDDYSPVDGLGAPKSADKPKSKGQERIDALPKDGLNGPTSINAVQTMSDEEFEKFKKVPEKDRRAYLDNYIKPKSPAYERGARLMDTSKIRQRSDGKWNVMPGALPSDLTNLSDEDLRFLEGGGMTDDFKQTFVFGIDDLNRLSAEQQRRGRAAMEARESEERATQAAEIQRQNGNVTWNPDLTPVQKGRLDKHLAREYRYEDGIHTTREEYGKTTGKRITAGEHFLVYEDGSSIKVPKMVYDAAQFPDAQSTSSPAPAQEQLEDGTISMREDRRRRSTGDAESGVSGNDRRYYQQRGLTPPAEILKNRDEFMTIHQQVRKSSPTARAKMAKLSDDEFVSLVHDIEKNRKTPAAALKDRDKRIADEVNAILDENKPKRQDAHQKATSGAEGTASQKVDLSSQDRAISDIEDALRRMRKGELDVSTARAMKRRLAQVQAELNKLEKEYGSTASGFRIRLTLARIHLLRRQLPG